MLAIGAAVAALLLVAWGVIWLATSTNQPASPPVAEKKDTPQTKRDEEKGVAGLKPGMPIDAKQVQVPTKSTAWNNVRISAKNQEALKFEIEIERVRSQVAQLVPDMNQHRREVAEEMVAIDKLREEVAVTRTKLIHQKETLQDFASYKTAEAELRAQEKLLATREKALDAAREQLATMRQQKQDLEVQVEQLEAELKNVRIDDSQLFQCKATLAEIRNRLKLEETDLKLRAEYSDDGAIPVEK